MRKFKRETNKKDVDKVEKKSTKPVINGADFAAKITSKVNKTVLEKEHEKKVKAEHKPDIKVPVQKENKKCREGAKERRKNYLQN